MKVTKVNGIIESLKRAEQGKFILKFHTQCLLEKNDNIEISKRNIELEFLGNEMLPVNDFEQKCMMLLEQFDNESILHEENDEVREMFYIGILIDNISSDIISYTNLLSHYESSFETNF